MITKVSQDLEAEENMVGQAKSSIKNLDRRITKAQNPSTGLPDVPHTTSAAAARSAAAVVQAQTLRASTAQLVNQSTTKVPIAARAQIAAETPVLVRGAYGLKKILSGWTLLSGC